MKGQLTLPEDPQKVLDSAQAWFWTPAWQAGEQEADFDRAAGRFESFQTGEALIEELRSIAHVIFKQP